MTPFPEGITISIFKSEDQNFRSQLPRALNGSFSCCQENGFFNLLLFIHLYHPFPCNSLYNDMEKAVDGFSLDIPNTLPISSHLFLK